MNVVAGTNIFLAAALDAPEKQRIIHLTTDRLIIVPEILPYEIENALTSIVKRNQITKNEAMSVHAVANHIPVRLAQIDKPQALKLALDSNIHAYDAYFCIVQNHHRVRLLPWTIV
jgi:predicted nucleic acid-binding protein